MVSYIFLKPDVYTDPESNTAVTQVSDKRNCTTVLCNFAIVVHIPDG